MKRILAVLACLLGLFSSAVAAQTVSINGLPIGLGDPVEKVRSTLGTTLEPEPATSASRRDTKQLRLKTRGIWTFFDQTNQVYNIRLDAPFPGNVGGVKIGDSHAHLVKTLGKPAKTLKIGPALPDRIDPVLYYIDDVTTVRFDFDRDGLIETIFVMK